MAARPVLLLGVVLLAGTVTAVVGGCSPGARHRLLSTLFEGVPAEGEARRPAPVVRKPRRPPSPEASPSPVMAGVAAEPPAEPEASPPLAWAAVAARLPRDAAGGVDWARALREKAIEPRAGLDAGTESQEVLPLDVERVPEGRPLFTATFPHEPHTEVLACTNCHTEIFEMQGGADPITMAAIFAGEYCGRCHGKVAFAVPTGCPRCHLGLAPPAATAAAPPMAAKAPAVERLRTWEQAAGVLPRDAAGGVDWVKALVEEAIAPRAGIEAKAPVRPTLPLDVERVPAGQPEMKVVFPHQAHTRWLACTNCHTGIFQMKRGAAPITMDAIFEGRYCGVCHGKVAFDVATGCARCHVAMGGAR